MAKKIYANVNNSLHKAKKIYVNQNGELKKVKKAYVNVAGTLRPCYTTELVYYGKTDANLIGNDRKELTATSIGNKAIFAGGYDNINSTKQLYGNVEYYNQDLTKKETLQQLKQQWGVGLSSTENGVYGLCSTTVGKQVLIGGGYNVNLNGSTSGTLTIYEEKDMVRNEEKQLSVFGAYVAATSTDKYAYFGGGRSYYNTSDEIIVYTSDLSDLGRTIELERDNTNYADNRGLYYMNATTVGDCVFFTGGVRYGNGINKVAYSNQVTAITQIDNSKLTNITRLTTARACHAATRTEKYAVFAGGENSDGKINTIEGYTMDGTHIDFNSKLSLSRTVLAAATLQDYIIFSGGNGGSTSVDVFDTELVKMKKENGEEYYLSYARTSPAAATVGNYALFGGGGNSSVEVFMI